MLVLTRKPNERVLVGSDIEVTVLAVAGNQVRLGIQAPNDVPVHREEVALRIEQEGATVEREASQDVPRVDSSDSTLISALRTLARDVQCDDGVANAALREAADRLEALSRAIELIRDSVLHERYQLAEAGLDCDQVNAVLGIIDDNDPRVFD